MIETTVFKTNIWSSCERDFSNLLPDVLELQCLGGRNVSNMGGWQSESFISTDNAFMKDTIDYVFSKMKSVYQAYGIFSEPNLVNYWFNINPKFSYNKLHNHPKMYFSVIIYLKTPSDCGDLVLERSDNFECFLPKPDLSNERNGISWAVPAQKNMLLVIPAYVSHLVEQNKTRESDDRRISIAMNFA